MNTPTLPSVILACVLLPFCMATVASAQIKALSGNDSLPGTALLTTQENLSEAMQDGAHRFIARVIEDSLKTRGTLWHRNTASPAAYNQSVADQRSHLKQILGVVDPRPAVVMERFGDDFNPSLVAESNSVQAWQVRWLTLENVWAEGLLLVPHKTEPKVFVVALPDASQQPERIAGLDGFSSHAWGRHLAESGIVVLIPTLIDCQSDFSGNPFVVANHPATAMQADQTHREWIYRQAFHMGRHVIGYEVQKILAGIDWIEARYGTKVTIGVAGYGEGGLLALQAAACDERIDAALVSGYFDSRQRVWNEPIYRNVFRLLSEFGDAEIASLIAPRPLVIEHSVAPEITGHKGSITTPEFTRVEAELRRAKSFTEPLVWPVELVSESGKPCAETCLAALPLFSKALDAPLTDYESIEPWSDRRDKLDVSARQKRTVKEVEAHVQTLVRQSELLRDNRFLGKLMPERLTNSRGGAWFKTDTVPTESAEAFARAAEPFRKELWSQIFGKITETKQPPNVRTRAIYEHPKWIAYDVVLDVYRESFAWGILVVPKDIPSGTRRPVVVCQHGLESIPEHVVLPGQWVGISDYAGKLAERGFVTFAPHNLYRHGDRFRLLDRKANAVGLSLYSLIIAHHEQILNWLKTLDFVDSNRIAFYGISYGGTTAMFVPSVLEDYCLSICTANLNDWTRKVAGTEDSGYMYNSEWEMPYFNMGNTYSHAEMAYLIAPRPFMVERGHHDAVARDSQVASEYAKIRWLYAQLGIAEKTEIEFFQGGHCIHGEGTFRFLHKHLQHPEPR